MVSLANSDYDGLSSLDSTSSLSSTTTNTSSSMSSSTHCDIEINSNCCKNSHSRSSSSSCQSRSCRRCASKAGPYDCSSHKNSGTCCPPATPTHGPRRNSPRKSVKNSSIQTDSPSLAAWKLSHEQQLMAKLNRNVSQSDADSLRSKIMQNDRQQTSSNDCQLMSEESHRPKCPLNHRKTSYDDLNFSSLPSSGMLSGGKAIAIIKGTPVQGKISNCNKMNISRSKNCSSKSSFSYGDSIYSDSECVKYSCMTSPVRSIRNGMSTMPSRSTVNYNCNGSGLNDVSVNSYYNNSWFKRNCYSLQRNTMINEETCHESDRQCGSSSFTRKNSEPNIPKCPPTPTRCPPTPTRCPPNKLKLQTFASGNSSNHSLTSPYSIAQSESGRKQNLEKCTDLHSSALSLASNSTICTPDDKHSLEIRKLKRDLEQANEKVVTLNSQLTTNAHMMTAFEQSLAAMTSRLQRLTSISEKKDSELSRLRAIVEELSKNRRIKPTESVENSPIKKSAKNDKKREKTTSMVTRRHTFNSTSGEFKPRITRNRSKESISSSSDHESCDSKRKNDRSKMFTDCVDKSRNVSVQSSKGWFRSSLTKAFRKSRSNSKCRELTNDGQIRSSIKSIDGDSISVPNSPLMPFRTFRPLPGDSEEMVDELKQQLMEKERTLTELRLDALTAAHQLDNFKETINKMQSEMQTLRQDNNRLQRLITTNSLASSRSSELNNGNSVCSQADQKQSASDNNPDNQDSEDNQKCELNELEKVNNTVNDKSDDTTSPGSDPFSDMLLRLQVASTDDDANSHHHQSIEKLSTTAAIIIVND